MVFIAGLLKGIWSIAAIDSAAVENTRFLLSDLNTWGWIMLFVGVIQLIAGFSIWAGGGFGRWIVGAGLSSIGARLSIPACPLGALCIFRARHPGHLRPGRLRRPQVRAS